MIDNPGVTDAQREEVARIFADTEFLECMERGLTNTGKATDPALARQRRKDAIEAFSKNPADFWAMIPR